MKISKQITDSVYGKADRLKMSKKFFSLYLESCIATGRVEAMENILNKHKAQPFNTVDELVGELQLEVVQSWNTFNKLWPQTTLPISIERVLKDQGFTQ